MGSKLNEMALKQMGEHLNEIDDYPAYELMYKLRSTLKEELTKIDLPAKDKDKILGIIQENCTNSMDKLSGTLKDTIKTPKNKAIEWLNALSEKE